MVKLVRSNWGLGQNSTFIQQIWALNFTKKSTLMSHGAQQVVSALTIRSTALDLFNRPTVSNQVSNHFSLMEIDDIDHAEFDFDHTVIFILV